MRDENFFSRPRATSALRWSRKLLAARAGAADLSLTLEPPPRRGLGEPWDWLEPPLGGGWGSRTVGPAGRQAGRGSGAVSHAGRRPASAPSEASAPHACVAGG